MTTDISALAPSQSVSATAASNAVMPAMISAVVMSQEPVVVDTIPAIPPADVLSAIQTASQSYDALAASGHHVHFASDPQNGRVSIQVLGPDDNTVSTISPSKMLDLASGGSLH